MLDVSVNKTLSRSTRYRRHRRRVIADAIEAELEELASAFEGAGTDAIWKGSEIAHAIRERIKYRKVVQR